MTHLSDKALVLLSGGQDSATCLAYAKSRHHELYTIAFNYHQRHVCELEMAKRLSNRVHAIHKEVDLSVFRDLTSNSLTDDTMTIEMMDNGLPNTFVPGRNHLFLSVAYLTLKKANFLWT